MNNYHPQDLYHDSSSPRSPRADPYHTQSLNRAAPRPFDAYPPHGNTSNNNYPMDDAPSRFDAMRFPPQDRIASGMPANFGSFTDMNQMPAWNSSGFGHNNTLAALGATTRAKPGASRHAGPTRGTLPSMWMDQPQPLQPAANFPGFPQPPLGFSSMRADPLAANESDEDLIPTAIVIKNIPFAVKKEQLVQVMTDMNLPLPYAFNYHFDNGVFRGLAFANFTSPEETGQVIQAMNHLDLHGRKLRVEYKKMLPQAERDRIEREKRERRGQLEEQHRPIGGSQLNTQHSMSSLSSHMPAASPSPNSVRNAGAIPPIDYNDPITLEFHSKLILFKADPTTGDIMPFPADLPATQRRIVHSLAHLLGLGHASHGVGEQRSVHVYRNPGAVNGMSPQPQQGMNMAGMHPLEAQRRQLNRAATTDFSNVRQQEGFYGGLGNQSAGLLGFPDTQGGLSIGSNLRAAKSFADLRSYTPSPAQSASSFPAGLTNNISRFQDYAPGSPGSSRSNITPTTTAMPEGLLTGMGGMNLGGGFSQPTAGSPHRLRGMMSWDREMQGPGPIGGHRAFSGNQQDERHRPQPSRAARGGFADRGGYSSRGRPNGSHQQRGSDDLSSSGVEIVVE